MPMFLMLAGEYHTAMTGGPLPAGCPAGWDEAFVDLGLDADGDRLGYREVWDLAKARNPDGTIDFDIGPYGRTVAIKPDATVKVR